MALKFGLAGATIYDISKAAVSRIKAKHDSRARERSISGSGDDAA